MSLDLHAFETDQGCVFAAMDAIATLCAANGGSYKITIPEHIRKQQGEVIVIALSRDTLEFAYLPNGTSYQ